jgi:DNA-binding XRE family transcriptional regulator
MGNTLRSAREEKGLTQAQLAKAADVSLRTIIAIEKGDRNPTFEVLFPLIHALGISADQIFYPDAAPLTAEQDQFMRDLLDCDEKTQRIVIPTLRSLTWALRQDD